jgi:hypothetical protein
MAGLTGELTSVVVSKLTATTDGVNVRVGAITQADASLQAAGIRTIIAQNASADISEKSGHSSYPALFIYCDKVSNTLKEKFRRFSGKAHVVIEIRHSQDKLDGIEASLQVYVDAVCALLDDSRGNWGCGSLYAGGYEVTYEAVARGGKNFLQRAKVGFEVEVSK